jgi:glutaredoxin 3
MKLELFHREACPYSAKVRDYISSHGLKSKIDYKDIEASDANLEKLETLTHDEQVPCLVIDGKPMLESDDIIDWLKENMH